jgi:hypothetical protein
MYYRVLKSMSTDGSRTSETSGGIDLRTRQYIPEDSELHIGRRENPKSFMYVVQVLLMFTKTRHHIDLLLERATEKRKHER